MQRNCHSSWYKLLLILWYAWTRQKCDFRAYKSEKSSHSYSSEEYLQPTEGMVSALYYHHQLKDGKINEVQDDLTKLQIKTSDKRTSAALSFMTRFLTSCAILLALREVHKTAPQSRSVVLWNVNFELRLRPKSNCTIQQGTYLHCLQIFWSERPRKVPLSC